MGERTGSGMLGLTGDAFAALGEEVLLGADGEHATGGQPRRGLFQAARQHHVRPAGFEQGENLRYKGGKCSACVATSYASIIT